MMKTQCSELAFLRAIAEANSAVRSWPEWLRLAIHPIPIRAPGVPDAVYVLDGRISLQAPPGVSWDTD